MSTRSVTFDNKLNKILTNRQTGKTVPTIRTIKILRTHLKSWATTMYKLHHYLSFFISKLPCTSYILLLCLYKYFEKISKALLHEPIINQQIIIIYDNQRWPPIHFNSCHTSYDQKIINYIYKAATSHFCIHWIISIVCSQYFCCLGQVSTKI